MGAVTTEGAPEGSPTPPLSARQLLRAIPTPTVVHKEGWLLAWNPAAASVLGLDASTAPGRFNLFERLTPDQLSEFTELRQREVQACGPGGHTSWKRLEVATADGRTIVLALSCAQTSLDGAPAVMSFLQDQTQDDALDHALRYSREVAVLSTDAQGRTIWCNPASTQLTGYTLDEMRGRRPGQVLQCEKTDPAEVVRLGRHLRAGSSVVSELINRHKSGRDYWVRLQILPAWTPGGDCIGYIGLQTDVTAEVERRQRREHSRDEKLLTFSHEVRTPLNAITNLLDLIKATPQTRDSAQWLGYAIQAAQSLKDLVNTILDDRRLDHIESQVLPRPTRMQDLIGQVSSLAAGYGANPGVQMRFICPPDLPVLDLRSDLVLRTLLNLVSNALKYTPAGFVEVRVERDGQASTPERLLLRLSVTDTGIGMTADEQARVRKPFETVASSQRAGQASTGLGLGLCERMLATLGSTLRLHSSPGVGTTASFELLCPVVNEDRWPAPISASADALPDLSGMRVLVVDDNPLNLLVSRLQLERLGAAVETHAGASSALQQLFAQAPQSFDVVLMDLNMPELDGVEAARRIHLQPGFEQQVIFALSGEIDPGAVERAVGAGIAEFISKPFEIRSLAITLARHRRGGSAAPGS